jgi:hypothetical protein
VAEWQWQWLGGTNESSKRGLGAAGADFGRVCIKKWQKTGQIQAIIGKKTTINNKNHKKNNKKHEKTDKFESDSHKNEFFSTKINAKTGKSERLFCHFQRHTQKKNIRSNFSEKKKKITE